MKAHIDRFMKYFIVGASAAVVNICVFFVCENMLGVHYIISGIIAFIIATLYNFIIARKFVFVSKHDSIIKESMLIYAASAVGLCVDTGVLYVCVEFLGLDSMIGKIIATGSAFVFNFALRNFIIYKD
ncbi:MULTISPECIES: GtrA family protein [unclassified Helicobacter]|uniref:GtrA family protein n=1 Tax=unclassified Helicobacter TaxID=2593540 RepID=UPI000805DE33|nr:MULTISPECIES: GtrA family protein [unclassified Helicobacter]OBV29599.1 hypothetical protein BA723_04780 [Helicobacter sp. CLO-3]